MQYEWRHSGRSRSAGHGRRDAVALTDALADRQTDFHDIALADTQSEHVTGGITAMTVRASSAIAGTIGILLGMAACGGGATSQQPPCHTPAIGFVQLLYPVPNSIAPSGTTLAIYGIAQPFPSSSTVPGTGPFPITLTAGATSINTAPTTLPSPLPSPMATPFWPPDQQSEIYAVSFPALSAGTTYTVTATEPAYACAVPNIRNRTTAIGSFDTQ